MSDFAVAGTILPQLGDAASIVVGCSQTSTTSYVGFEWSSVGLWEYNRISSIGLDAADFDKTSAFMATEQYLHPSAAEAWSASHDRVPIDLVLDIEGDTFLVNCAGRNPRQAQVGQSMIAR